MSILMIKVRKADQGFFLLIYDLKNTAVKSKKITIMQLMKRIINLLILLMKRNIFFHIRDNYKFRIQINHASSQKDQKKDKILLRKLNLQFQLNLKFLMKIQIQNFIQQLLIKIIANSNQSQLYTLQLLNLSQNILAGEILNQENIFGNIEEVEIIGSENISVYQPLIFILIYIKKKINIYNIYNNISAICNFYQFGICIYDKSILRNIFDSNTFIKFSQDFVQLPFYIGFNSEDCSHAIYLKLDESLYMNEFNFCRNNQIQKQNYTISNNAHTMKIFKQINDLQMTGLDNGIILFYFQYKPFLNSVLLNSFINVDFDLFDGAKINDFTYFFLNIGFNVIELKVFNVIVYCAYFSILNLIIIMELQVIQLNFNFRFYISFFTIYSTNKNITSIIYLKKVN